MWLFFVCLFLFFVCEKTTTNDQVLVKKIKKKSKSFFFFFFFVFCLSFSCCLVSSLLLVSLSFLCASSHANLHRSVVVNAVVCVASGVWRGAAARDARWRPSCASQSLPRLQATMPGTQLPSVAHKHILLPVVIRHLTCAQSANGAWPAREDGGRPG